MSQRHLLIVEDEPGLNQALCALVQELDWTPISCVSGEAALTVLRQKKTLIEGALIDQRLPNCSGLELAQRLQALHPEFRILLMSGAPMPAQEEWAFLPKPFGLEDLHLALLSIGLEDLP